MESSRELFATDRQTEEKEETEEAEEGEGVADPSRRTCIDSGEEYADQDLLGNTHSRSNSAILWLVAQGLLVSETGLVSH